MGKANPSKMAMKMKSMKAMKAMKSGMKKSAMKSGMRKKAMKVSIIGKRRSVFSGKKDHTQSGLKKSDLKKNKAGKIVSKKASEAAKKKKGYKKIMAWGQAFKAARKALGIKGFCPCGGKTSKGQALLKKTRSLYKK